MDTQTNMTRGTCRVQRRPSPTSTNSIAVIFQVAYLETQQPEVDLLLSREIDCLQHFLSQRGKPILAQHDAAACRENSGRDHYI